MTMKVVISVTLEIRKADIEVAFLASAALTMTLIMGIRGASIRGLWGGRVLLMNSTDSNIPARDLSRLFSVFLTSFICNDDFALKLLLPENEKPVTWATMHRHTAKTVTDEYMTASTNINPSQTGLLQSRLWDFDDVTSERARCNLKLLRFPCGFLSEQKQLNFNQKKVENEWLKK